jgi:hypothetical protein
VLHRQGDTGNNDCRDAREADSFDAVSQVTLVLSQKFVSQSSFCEKSGTPRPGPDDSAGCREGIELLKQTPNGALPQTFEVRQPKLSFQSLHEHPHEHPFVRLLSRPARFEKLRLGEKLRLCPSPFKSDAETPSMVAQET